MCWRTCLYLRNGMRLLQSNHQSILWKTDGTFLEDQIGASSVYTPDSQAVSGTTGTSGRCMSAANESWHQRHPVPCLTYYRYRPVGSRFCLLFFGGLRMTELFGCLLFLLHLHPSEQTGCTLWQKKDINYCNSIFQPIAWWRMQRWRKLEATKHLIPLLTEGCKLDTFGSRIYIFVQQASQVTD